MHIFKWSLKFGLQKKAEKNIYVTHYNYNTRKMLKWIFIGSETNVDYPSLHFPNS